MNNEIIELVTKYTAIVLLIVSALAFAVSLITQLTKEVGFLKKIPTKVQVAILSLIFSPLAYFIYMAFYGYTFLWYHIVIVIIFGFPVVYFVATRGWGFISEQWKRVQYKKDGDK